MSVLTINGGHVLFPHRVNTAQDPTWEKRWENQIADSEFGRESRASLRKASRLTLRWTVTSLDVAEDNQLADRILAAKKTGLAAAPLWGRGSQLAFDASGSQAILEPTLWQWRPGDWAFFLDASGNFDAALVDSLDPFGVGGPVLNLATPLAGSYRAGELVWPIIMGKFSADNLSGLTPQHGQAQLSISELTSRDAAGLGAYGPQLDGVGYWIIEDTNIVQ